jgi:hypothetical protein
VCFESNIAQRPPSKSFFNSIDRNSNMSGITVVPLASLGPRWASGSGRLFKVDCGKPIDVRRLAADPAAATCLKCQRLDEPELVTHTL